MIGFDAWKTSDDSQAVPGLGDEAFFNRTTGVMVRRGTATFQFYPLGNLTAEESLDLATRIAQAASSRF